MSNRSRARSKARRLALQALYQWQLSGNALHDIEKQFLAEQDFANADRDYFHELLFGVARNVDTLDAHFAAALDRPINEVDPIERALLRLGTYELAHQPDVPYRVAINESVELAKTFGAEQGHKYVNSILDGVARKLRAAEIAAKR
jgi:N utilization substance protein B